MTVGVQPALVLKTASLDHETITFPTTNGIAHPCGIGVLGQFSIIRKYLPPGLNRFEENDRFLRCDDDLRGIGGRPRSRNATDDAGMMRIIFGLSISAVLINTLGPGRHHDLIRL